MITAEDEKHRQEMVANMMEQLAIYQGLFDLNLPDGNDENNNQPNANAQNAVQNTSLQMEEPASSAYLQALEDKIPDIPSAADNDSKNDRDLTNENQNDATNSNSLSM